MASLVLFVLPRFGISLMGLLQKAIAFLPLIRGFLPFSDSSAHFASLLNEILALEVCEFRCSPANKRGTEYLQPSDNIGIPED